MNTQVKFEPKLTKEAVVLNLLSDTYTKWVRLEINIKKILIKKPLK